MFQRLCKKKVSGRGGRKDNAVGFVDVVDEFMDDDYEEESPRSKKSQSRTVWKIMRLILRKMQTQEMGY